MAHESKQVTKTSLTEFPKWRGEEGEEMVVSEGVGLAAVLHILVYYKETPCAGDPSRQTLGGSWNWTWKTPDSALCFTLSLTRASCSTNQSSEEKPVLAGDSVTAALPSLS